MKQLLIIFILSVFFVSSPTEAKDCYGPDTITDELDFLMDGTAPVINKVNQCKEDHNLKDNYLKKVNERNVGFPQALFNNPLVCIKAMFQGLKDSVEDLMSAIWDMAKAFSKVINTTLYGTYSFLKAAFTGNLTYWFAEASNNGSEFINKLLGSLKKIPEAVGGFLSDKSEDWNCRNDEGQVEMACRIGGYLGTDTLAAALTLGWNKLSIANKLRKMKKKILPKKKVTKNPKKNMNSLGSVKAGKLEDIIPRNKRNSRMVIEADKKGHYTVRYFDEAGNAKAFDGSPFYHMINKKHRRAGVGTNRLKDRQFLHHGEHFTVDVDPSKFNNFLQYVEKKKGKMSVACTRTACESMKAAGVNIGQAKVPSIDKLYKGLLSESKRAKGPIRRVQKSMTPIEQAALIKSYRTGTNLVKIQFGLTMISGYFYAPAFLGTPLNFVIDRMDAYTVPQQ